MLPPGRVTAGALACSEAILVSGFRRRRPAVRGLGCGTGGGRVKEPFPAAVWWTQFLRLWAL